MTIDSTHSEEEIVEAMVSAWRDYLTHHCHEDDDACAMRAALAVARQMDGSARDAARYRWLREQNWTLKTFSVVHPRDAYPGSQTYTHEFLDSAIDAAMRGEAGDE